MPGRCADSGGNCVGDARCGPRLFHDSYFIDEIVMPRPVSHGSEVDNDAIRICRESRRTPHVTGCPSSGPNVGIAVRIDSDDRSYRKPLILGSCEREVDGDGEDPRALFEMRGRLRVGSRTVARPRNARRCCRCFRRCRRSRHVTIAGATTVAWLRQVKCSGRRCPCRRHPVSDRVSSIRTNAA